MTKNEQIEEMANDLRMLDSFQYNPKYTVDYQRAMGLHSLGYRKVKRGEWIRQEKEIGKVTTEAVCSKCGRDVVYQVVDNKWEFENFCPHCGADMRGELYAEIH